MPTLTKEEFWDPLKDKFPDAFDFFAKWIDDYKEESNWKALFNETPERPAPKFHDLPFEMQNGIIARFELELFNNAAGHGKEIAKNVQANYKGQIVNLFRDLQSQIVKRQDKFN